MELPDQVLEVVLSNLNEEDLKKCLNIKKLREIILNSPVLMRKLTLCLYYEDFEAKVNFVKKYGKNVAKVSFGYTDISSISEIHRVLVHTPNIEYFYFVQNPSENDDIVDNSETLLSLQIPEFSNLKKLEILTPKPIIRDIVLYFWRCDRIQELVLYQYSQDNFKELVEFLFKQKCLKKLDIQSESIFNVPVSESLIKNCSFRLTELSMFFSSFSFNQQFKEFCKNLTDMEKLSFSCDTIDQKVFEHLFEGRNKLKTVQVNPSTFYNILTSSYFEKDITLEKVDQLDFYSEFIDPLVFEKYIRMFPNVQIINFHAMTLFHYGALKNLQELRKLSMWRWDCHTLCNVLMPKLESVTVSYLKRGVSAFWRSFTDSTPNLKSLVIEDMQNSRSTHSTKNDFLVILESIYTLQKLDEFYISCDIKERSVDDFNVEIIREFSILVSIKDIKEERPQMSVSSYFRSSFTEEFDRLKAWLPNAITNVIYDF